MKIAIDRNAPPWWLGVLVHVFTLIVFCAMWFFWPTLWVIMVSSFIGGATARVIKQDWSKIVEGAIDGNV